jgi:hypothetical protein
VWPGIRYRATPQLDNLCLIIITVGTNLHVHFLGHNYVYMVSL